MRTSAPLFKNFGFVGNAGKKLLTTTALTAAGLMALGGSAQADNWVDLTTTSGSTTTDLSQANTTNLNLNTQRAIVEGDLDINSNWTVNVSRGNLVAIDRENDPTFIFGHLNCAGSCHVIDANGVFVGASGSINAAAISLSDGELLNPAGFMAGGPVQLGNFSGAGIINQGTITVADAGIAAFVSPFVSNQGIINARMGKVVMAAGETVTLDLYGDNLFEIAVEGEVADALLENKGTINAEGGTVMMTAQAAKNAVDNVINMDGVIDVSSVTQKGGKIILSGGKKGVVNVSGKMDASGTDGGDVDVTGQNILVADTAEILVGGGKGNDGKGNGGDAYIYADNAAIFRGLILGRGGVNGGNGANAEVSGPYVEYTGLTNLLAYNGINGTLLLDPVDVKIQAGGAGVIPGTNVFDPTGLGNTTILGWDTIDTALGLGNLTITTTGNASQTNDGDIKVEASHLYSSANALNLFAHEAVRIDDGVSVINIGTGDITLLGGWNGSLASPGFDNSITDPNLGRVYFRAGSSVVTFGTLNLLGRNLIDMQAGSAAAATNVNMVSDQIVMDTSGSPALVNATDTVSISRNRTGDISLGADHGGLVLSQAEIANIGATTLEVGGATTDLTVDGVDTTTATISGTVFLSAAGDIEFDGANVFNALNATAGDDVLVDGGSSITTKTGGVSLTANNAVNDGLTVMQVEGTIDTTLAGAAGTVDLNANNHFVEIDPTGSVLTDGGKLTANSNVGFDIDNGATVSLGNGGAHINAPVVHLGDDIDTTGPITGTASTVDVENDDAEIQDGVDVAANNATVNVAAGTYNESVNVNKAGLKLLGNNAGTAGYDPRDPESIVTGGSPAFTVNADNITIDGFTMDGPTLTYGVLLNDVKGTKISNNIISRSSIAGIGGVVDHNNAPVGTLLVENNKIDDSNTGDGIKLWGDSAGENGKQALVGVKIDILGNEIGTDGDDTGSDDDGVSGNGIVFGQVGDDDGTIADGGTNVSAVINIKENDIAGLEGVRFDGSVDGATLDLSDNTDISGYVGDGVRFAGKVTSSSVTIAGNTEIGGFANGISFSGIDGGTVDILNNDSIRGYFVDGVSFGAGSPSISGGAFVTVAGNAIQGDVDGIYVEDDITGPGTKFWVGGNTITAGGDGVDIDHIENGAQANIGGVVPHDSASTSVNKGNVITAGGNGIEFDAGVDAIALVRNNRISAGDDGVNVRDGDPGHTTGVDSGAYVEISSNQIGSMGSDTIGDDGIDFDDSITGNATVLISGNAIGRSGAKVGDDGIDIDTVTGGATVSIINNTDIRAADNGIEISGPVNGGASVTISGNNHGIHADDHGIYFGSALSGGATVNIHDNIIGANEDHDSTGSGIWFDGTITSATVNIGDGAYGSFTGGASNIIRVDGNAGGSQSGLDGIHFDDDIGSGAVINIDGNRLGYFAFSVGGPLTEERLADDGIEFSGEIKGNADINITDNYIRAKGDGVRFSDKIRDFANVLIGGLGDNNAINAWHNGVSFLNDITGQSLVEISYNGITASNDGIYFGDKIDNAKTTGGISEQELLIKNNTIWGRNNGIHFNGEIDGERHDTRIAGNDIEGEDGQGIVFDDDIDEAHVRIVENTRIEGEKDGIRFLGDIEDGARVNIDDNAKIEGKDEEAIHFFRKVADSFVSIFSNDDIRAGENGIEFNGEIDNSTIVISENNHGIHADDHGILFTNSIHSGSDIDIHDNIISANEDNGSTGDGIHFGGNIYTATINIGDGGGSSFGSDPSNFIRGKDGIHFEGSLNKGSQIVIDGNRIGYGKTSGGSTYEDRVDDDGIQFDGEIRGNADVKITDNYIKSDDDGISFRNNVKDDARILIGGRYDGNTIDADGEGDGIQFEDKIEDHSLIEISHNSIYADRNGVVFNDDTSNHLHSGHEEEILIAYNTIDGDENGILFEGRASHALHDIVIRDNYKIRGDGKGDHGISFTGGIDDAELTIKHNDEIYGAEDGIHITGQFFNDAKIRIHGNTDIKGDNDDAIEVNDYGSDWGLDLEIDHNHAHWSGDNGIYVRNIENADIHDNTVHDVDGNGIYGSHIDNGNIASNTIYNTGGNGILVNPTDHIDIAYNTIHDVDEDGIRVDDGHGADIWGNHIGRTGDDGIDVNDNDYVDIWDNYIHDTGRDSEHGDGISVDNSYRAEIKKNRITGAGRDGINVKDSNKTVIGWNKIFAEGGNYYYHDYGQEGAGRDGIHVENSDDLLVIGNDVTADLGYGHKGAIDRLGAGRHGIYVEGGKDIDIMYNHILGDSEHRRHYYNSVDSVGEDGIHVTAAEDILIKKNEVSRAGDDGIEVIVGNVEERREIRLGITSIRDRGRHEDDTNKVIIIGNEVSRSGDDGIVVTTEQDYDRREENKGPGVQSFGSQGGNDWDDNRSDGKKLFIKIADNDVEKSGDDGIEVNLKTSAGNNDNNNFPGPVGFLQQEEGFGGFGGHHDRPDNEILISDNNVSKSGDDGIVVKIAPKEEKNGNNEKPDEFFMQTSSGMDNNSGGIRNYVRIDGNKVFHSGDDGIQVDITTDGGSNYNNQPPTYASKGLEQNEGFFGGFGGHHDRPDNEILISDNNVSKSGDDGIVVKIAPKEEKNGNNEKPDEFFRQTSPGMDSNAGGIRNYIQIDGNKVFHSGDDGIQVDITTDGGSNDNNQPPMYLSKGLDGFGGQHDRPDNEILISDNNVSKSGDDGIVVKIAPKEERHNGYGNPGKFAVQSLPGMDNNAGGIRNYVRIDGNKVFHSGDDGIQVDITTAAGSNDNGYPQSPAPRGLEQNEGFFGGFGGHHDRPDNEIVISDNLVIDSRDDGIVVKIAPKEERHNNGYGNPGKFAVQSLPGMDNSRGGINNYVKIDGNKVFHSGDDGIQVDITTDGGSNGYDYPQTTAFKGLGQSEGFFGGFGTQNKNTIIVSGNKVGFSGDDGIDISVKTEKDKERRGFQDNFMSLDYPGYSGSATTSNFIKVSHNDVFRSRDDGITIDVDNPRGERMYKGGYDDMYDSPLMTNSFGPDYGYGGYRGGNTNKVVIIGNDVRNSDDDGIQVVANKGSDVDLIMVRNTVRDSGDNGILLISKGGRHGGYYGGPQTEEKSLEPSVSLLSGYGYGGGHSHGGVFNSTLIDNIVENSGSNGLYVKGPHHGDVVLKGNTFINNPVGARFESGRIDVSDEERPNTFIVTPDYELPEGYKYVTGMQFDLAKKWKPTSLTIVGETLGTTAFYGFINRGVGTAYYVRFEDGAILDKYGNVIEIDGTRVDWDGFVPADNLDGDGNIPASVLAAIEARLFDADDPLLNGRGQIFVGTPAEESGATVAQEDIFNYFGPFRGTLSGLNVTIRGLPGIPGGPLSLNAITPFAGGEGEGEGGGTSPEDLNAIEAAAGGGESSPCLGDAVGIAETGQSVNVTYGTSPEETLAGAASCSSEL